MKNLFFNLITVFYVISLFDLHVCQAHETLAGVRGCCLTDTANFTVINGEPFCVDSTNGNYKIDIDCHGMPVVVIDYDSIEEIKALQEEYCYIYDEEKDNTTLHVVAICNEEYHTPLSVHLMPISFIFLVITFLIYYKIQTLRAPEDIAFIISVVCLAVFIFIHVPHYWLHGVPELHSIFAFLELYVAQFAIVAYFTWLNVIMANQLKKNMSSYSMSVSKKWIYLNHIYGWGVPCLVLIITLANSLKDNERSEEEIYYLESYEFSKFIPIGILWFINCVLLGMVLYYAIKYPSEKLNRRVIQYRSWKYFQLFLVSGFLWIFELLSWIFRENKVAQEIFDITDCINALQGFYLFVVMVVLRLHVRRSLAGTRILCLTLPQNWSVLEDSDDVELIENENSVNVHQVSSNPPIVL